MEDQFLNGASSERVDPISGGPLFGECRSHRAFISVARQPLRRCGGDETGVGRDSLGSKRAFEQPISVAREPGSVFICKPSASHTPIEHRH